MKQIDIKELVREKRPALAKIMPGFVYTLLGKIINIEQINLFVSKYGDRYGIDFADAMVEFIDLKFDVKGEENLPSVNERTIFVSNHPFGGPDGISLISYLGKRYPKIKFPVNDFLLKLQNLNSVFVPINKHGGLGRDAVLDLENIYASDKQVIMFPAGLVSRMVDGKIQDLVWKKHFVSKAIQYGRTIVPIRIYGRNSALFYNFSKWRRRLKIPINLEMLLLPRETLDKRGRDLTIVIGKPIDPTQLKSLGDSPTAIAAKIREQIYNM